MSFRDLTSELKRSRDLLVPAAFQVLWTVMRFIVLYGGRASAKSWSIARVLLIMGKDSPLRVLCCREIQGSLKESAYRLLADQIQTLGLDDFYTVGADSIVGKNGTRFFFEGLRYNSARIRSYEGCDICWIEEAQSVSDLSFETLLPTIRKKGSRFFISFNPMLPPPGGDPVYSRFVASKRGDVLAKKVSWRDNPYLSAEALAEKDWLERTDADAYRHVWEGEARVISDALVLKGKFEVEDFTVSEDWSGPHHGLDYGFSQDPCAAVRCYVDDRTRTLYVDKEFWQLGCEIDALPDALETAIPGISRHVVYADSARPESTSYLSRHGIVNCRSAEKWPGSIADGIAYLRSFARIVISPACRHFLDEANRYSYKTDRLTGAPLPEPVDGFNHLIDSLRYALSPLIRNQPTSRFMEPPPPTDFPVDVARVFAFAAIVEDASDSLGTVYFAVTGRNPSVVVLDWSIEPFEQRTLDGYFPAVAKRLNELIEETRPAWRYAPLVIEPTPLGKMLLEQGRLRLAGVDALDNEPLMLKDMTVRAVELGNFLAAGAVALTHEADDKRVIYKGAQSNFLNAEIAVFAMGDEKKKIGPLLAALATGALNALASAIDLNIWQVLGGNKSGAPGTLASLLEVSDRPPPEPPMPPEPMCGAPRPVPEGVVAMTPEDIAAVMALWKKST